MRGPSWYAQKAGKRDANAKAIAKGLEKLSYLVADLGGASNGIPDYALRLSTWAVGRWEFIEVKTEDGELTKAQIELHARWLAKGVKIHVVKSLDDALRACK